MHKSWIIILLFLFSCLEEELPFNPTIDHVYDNLFLVWKRTNLATNNKTGEISRTITRESNLQYIFNKGTVSRSTDGGELFVNYPDSYVGSDSISLVNAEGEVIESFFVREIYRMKNGSILDKEKSNPRDEVFPELKGFYLFLELEKKQKTDIEGSTVTEIYLLYAEGYPEE